MITWIFTLRQKGAFRQSEQARGPGKAALLLPGRQMLVWGTLLMMCWSLGLAEKAQAQAQPRSSEEESEEEPAVERRRSREAGRAFILSHSAEEYEGHQQVWAIAQDTSGLLYAGNSNGLSVYDGARWRSLPMDTKETGARERIVRALAQGPDGRVYAGLIGSLGYFAPDARGRQRYVSLMEEVPADQRDFNSVWSVEATSNGVFFMTEKRLFRWADGQMTSWSAGAVGGEGAGLFFLAFAVRDQLYVHQRGGGLWRVERDGAREGGTLQPVPGGKAFRDDAVYTVLPYGRDALLVGSAKQGLQVLEADGTRRSFSEEATAFLAEHGLYCGRRLRGGRYAFGTRRGGAIIVSSTGEVQTVYDRADGLPNNKVQAMASDRQGGLWLALGDGISRVEWERSLTHFGEREGLQGIVQKVLRHRGHLYAATTQGLYRLRRASTPLQDAQFERVAGVGMMVFDLLRGEETLLAATNEGVLGVREGKAREVFAPPRNTAFTLHRSRTDSNRVYVGFIDGLAMIEKDRRRGWIGAHATVEEVNGTIRSMALDSAGRLWLGTSGSGITRLTDGPPASLQERLKQGERFDTTDGLPVLTDLFVDEVNGRLAVATRAGLHRYDTEDRHFAPDSTFGARFARARRVVAPVVEGTGNTIWIRASVKEAEPERRIGEGLYRLSPDGQGGYRAETPLARLAGTSISGFGLYPEADGTLWVGGSDGLYRYVAQKKGATPLQSPGRPAGQSLSEERLPAPSGSTLIRRVATVDSDSLIFGGHGRLSARPVFAYEEGNLRFSYAAPRFDAPADTRYQVRLEGLDDAWSRWTEETRKDYTTLAEGKYVFRVRAQDAHGRLSREASFAFTVLPPWYRTTWAYVAYLILAVGGIAGLIRARSAHLEARAERLEQVVDERTAEVQEQRRQLERQTERMEATNRELSHANEALREASEQKTELLSIAAHDLVTPLTSIKGFSEILIEASDPESERREPLEVIHEATESALQRVEDLRTSASLEGREAPLDVQRIDLKQLAQWMVKRFHPQAEAKDQPLRLAIPERPCLVNGDPGKIREVMSNLISNAIKYSPLGKPIGVRLQRTEAKVRFAVYDRGPGLTEEDCKHLFQPFQRLSPTPTAGEPSSGLGLYIVKKFVERHGGKVGYESEEGQGSTFFFELPVAEESVADDEEKHSHEARMHA